jgi:hypothetical protein
MDAVAKVNAVAQPIMLIRADDELRAKPDSSTLRASGYWQGSSGPLKSGPQSSGQDVTKVPHIEQGLGGLWLIS